MAFPVSPSTLAAASRALSFLAWAGRPGLPAWAGAFWAFGVFAPLAGAAFFFPFFVVAISDLLGSLRKPAARRALPHQGKDSYLAAPQQFQGILKSFSR